MRILGMGEACSVAGGMMVGPEQYLVPSGELVGPLQFGALGEFVRWAGGGLLYDAVKAAVGQIGVAGQGANETDNGGTSYGIDVCNTFGCPN